MTKPLVIFIGEQHDNMAYGSLIEQIVKNCQGKGLNLQVFSEFESQTQKIKMVEEVFGEPLRNQLPDKENFEAQIRFLDGCFVKMGDLDEREKIMAESLVEYKKQGLTPRQLYDQTKDKMIVSPDIYKFLEERLKQGEETGFFR